METLAAKVGAEVGKKLRVTKPNRDGRERTLSPGLQDQASQVGWRWALDRPRRDQERELALDHLSPEEEDHHCAADTEQKEQRADQARSEQHQRDPGTARDKRDAIGAEHQRTGALMARLVRGPTILPHRLRLPTAHDCSAYD